MTVIIAAIVILAIIFILFMLRRNRRSKLPDYLKGKRIQKCKDLITEREVYITSHRDAETREFIYQAYFCDDGTACEQALYQQAYGVMYFGEGNLRVIPRKVAREFLDAIARGQKPVIGFRRSEGKNKEDERDSSEG